MDEPEFKISTEVIAQAQIGVWEWNIATDQLTTTSYVRKMHGLPAGARAVAKEKYLKQVHNQDKERIRKIFAEVLKKGNSINIEYRVIPENGLTRWLSLTGVLRREGDKPVSVSGIVKDITEERESKKRFEVQYKIANILADAEDAWEVSENILEAIGTLLDARVGILWRINSAGTHLLLAESWVVRSEYDSFISANKEQAFKKGEGWLGGLWTGQKPLSIPEITKVDYFTRKEIVKSSKLNSAFGFPVQVHGEFLGVIEFFGSRDFTPDDTVYQIVGSVSKQLAMALRRQQAEADRHAYMQQLAAVLQSVPVGITVEASADGRIIYANKIAATVFGQLPDKPIVGAKLDTLLGKQQIFTTKGRQIKPSQKWLEHEFGSSGALMRTLLFIDRSTGDERWYKITATPTVDNRLNKLIVMVYRDVSEQIEEQRQREMYLGLVGHELKNPLASIKAFAQLSQKRIATKKYDDLGKYVEGIERQADRLTSIILNMLDVTRIRAGKFVVKPDYCDIDELVQRTVNEFRVLAPDFNISRRGRAGKHVYMDNDRMRQVLINLLQNAINYSEDKKQVRISVKSSENEVAISIRDYGIGMSEKMRKHIFHLYKRGEEKVVQQYPGLGMGLYISSAIVKAHGGKIKVKSRERIGSVFTVILPIDNNAAKS